MRELRKTWCGSGLSKITMRIFLFFLLWSLCAWASGSGVQGKLNIINGASTECVMHYFYTQSGWTKIEGEVGRNGIDGLYYKKKNNIIREVLVSESKWNTSRLGLSGKGRTVRQMSKEWVIRTLKRLQKYKPVPEYPSILKLVQNGQYRARLFRLKPMRKSAIQITVYKIQNKGLKTFDKIRDTKLPLIDINAPKNSFERGVVRAYNGCRKKYLHKYMDQLSDHKINKLLKDNYIQNIDIQKSIQ